MAESSKPKKSILKSTSKGTRLCKTQATPRVHFSPPPPPPSWKPSGDAVTQVHLNQSFDDLEPVLSLESFYPFLAQPIPSPHSSDISESENENEGSKVYLIPRKSKREPEARVFFDSEYRASEAGRKEGTDLTAKVIWTKEGAGVGSDSEAEPDLLNYIAEQERRKDIGENISGESFWFDEERGVMRNLHASSISVTGYGDGASTERRAFGRADLLRPTLSPDEQRMLGIHVEPKAKKPLTPSTTSTSSLCQKKKTIRQPTTSDSELPADGGMGDGFHSTKNSESLK